MGPGDQADWRRRLRGMRTVRALQAQSVDMGVAERLSDEVLAAATANPEHSEAGQAAARDALIHRGHPADRWRMRVPGFVKRRALEKKGERLFFGFGRSLRKGAGALTWLSLIAVFIAAFVMLPAREEALRDAAAAGVVVSAIEDDATMDSAQMAPVLAALGPRHGAFQRALWAERTGMAAAAAFGVFFFVWLFASLLRRRPARLLLLRKFNVKSIGNAVAAMMGNELRPYGHICSLSDKHIRRSRFGWISQAIMAPANPLSAIWLIIGAPVRLIYRLFDRSRMGPALVTNARDYRNLARRLRDRIGLNLQIVTTSKEAFLVRTSDLWWRMVVRLLMDSADVIVVDVSQVTEGTAWELDVIRDEGVAARCVFVALWGRGEAAEAALKSWGFTNDCHFYAPDGHMVKRAPFRAAMLSAMRVTHGLSA